MDKESIDAVLEPVSEDTPCGNELEYDPAFVALEITARSKPEQQFGDSVIAAVEPDWRAISLQAVDLVRRSKDLRVVMLLLRASTRLHGVIGFVQGMQTLREMLARYWDGAYPRLDEDDNNDPTMRLNALAPLNDIDMVLQDLREAKVGGLRDSMRVRDIEVAYGKLGAKNNDIVMTVAQLEGALGEIFARNEDVKIASCTAADCISQLQSLINERVSSDFAVDFKALRSIAMVLQQTSKGLVEQSSVATDGESDPKNADAAALNSGAVSGGSRGGVASRQDAINTLDKVIRYLEQAEPGNPAPLLIKRAQRLIGVSFMDIMSDLAPDALSAIENITGRPPS